MSKFYILTISNDEFKIDYDLEKYQEEKSLDGKYIIESTVTKQDMDTKLVRARYKELQNVEHAFRDMKTDKLNIRPIFHVNEAQTRGHVFVCMFSYAIVKELETVLFPWLKVYNRKNNCKLSYHDITDELNEIQKEITKLFNIKMEDVMKA